VGVCRWRAHGGAEREGARCARCWRCWAPGETCEMNVGVCLCARFGHAAMHEQQRGQRAQMRFGNAAVRDDLQSLLGGRGHSNSGVSARSGWSWGEKKGAKGSLGGSSCSRRLLATAQPRNQPSGRPRVRLRLVAVAPGGRLICAQCRPSPVHHGIGIGIGISIGIG
jgi:hypothetical protein